MGSLKDILGFIDFLYENAGEVAHILNQNYMVTPKAKEYWERKKKLVCDFIKEYESDLFLEKEEETQYEFKEIF